MIPKSTYLTWNSIRYTENPKFQGILKWISQILHYQYSKQQKNIENLQLTEQNIVISFSISLCLLCASSFVFLNNRFASVLRHSTPQNWKFHKWLFVLFHKKLCLQLQLMLFCIFSQQPSTQMFSCKICKNFKNILFTEHLCWLLLSPKQIKKNKKIATQQIFLTPECNDTKKQNQP